MADVTLIQATELSAAPATDDYVWIWDSSVSQLKRISIANVISGFITGAGVIATGGFTLTVPQSMTAAGRNVANTFSALQTFSSGLTFGGSTLQNYTEGTWTVEVQGSSSNPTISYGTRTTGYTRIGNTVNFAFRLGINTITGGSGDIRITLPLPAALTNPPCAIRLSGVDLTGTPTSVLFLPVMGTSYGQILSFVDNGSETNEQISALANGDVISAAGTYFTS